MQARRPSCRLGRAQRGQASIVVFVNLERTATVLTMADLTVGVAVGSGLNYVWLREYCAGRDESEGWWNRSAKGTF